MSAQDEVDLKFKLDQARLSRLKHESAELIARSHTIRYMREALRQHQSWSEIGEALGITDTGARRYFERNRLKVT